MTSLHRPPSLMATLFIAKKELWLVEEAFLWQLNCRYHPLNWLHLIPRQKRMNPYGSPYTPHKQKNYIFVLSTNRHLPLSTRLDFLAQSVSALYQRNKKSHPHIIIAGDFNFSDINWKSESPMPTNPATASDMNTLLDFIEDNALTQHVTEPTQPVSLITPDLVLSSTPILISDVNVVPGMSDHDIVTFTINTNPRKTSKPPHKVYRYKSANMDSLHKDMIDAQEDFLNKCQTRSVDENWTLFKTRIHKAMDTLVRPLTRYHTQRWYRNSEHYGITGKTMKWIEAFLKHRTQLVVVNGSHSSTALVTSGVPQGTVLGPTLFLIIINDIVNCSTSTLRLFADDCCVYRQINSSDDHRALDQDLSNLHNWSNDWQMSFNIAKCKLLSITNKRKPSIYTYNLGSEQISTETTQKYT